MPSPQHLPQLHPPGSPGRSVLVEPSLPAACASLLSLRSAYAPPPPPSAQGMRLPPSTSACTQAVPSHNVSPVSVRGPRRGASRFWETVMSSSGDGDASRGASSSARSTSPASAHSGSGTIDEGEEEEGGCKMNIPCVVCGVRFRKPGHLNMHWRSVHASGSDATYPGKVGVAAHRVMAPAPGRVGKGSGGRAYGCPQCEARFRRGSDRNRHMRMVHAKIRPFECKQCGNHFGRKSFLEAHVLTVHEKLRPFRCECGAAFGQRSSLTRHIRKIHGREP